MTKNTSDKNPEVRITTQSRKPGKLGMVIYDLTVSICGSKPIRAYQLSSPSKAVRGEAYRALGEMGRDLMKRLSKHPSIIYADLQPDHLIIMFDEHYDWNEEGDEDDEFVIQSLAATYRKGGYGKLTVYGEGLQLIKEIG